MLEIIYFSQNKLSGSQYVLQLRNLHQENLGSFFSADIHCGLGPKNQDLWTTINKTTVIKYILQAVLCLSGFFNLEKTTV